MSEHVTFSVDSLLMSELGEHLVTKNYVALAELVKNAYDADADEVSIEFVNSRKRKGNESRIVISDNGHGMSFSQIREFWMRIATPNKRRNPLSPKYERVKTGDKGIGRFSCNRLARRTILESSAALEQGKVEYTKVIFDWEKYEPGKTLTEIPNYYERKLVSSDHKIGTTLQLIDLRDTWTQRDFDVLRRQVLSLSIITPTKRRRRKGGSVEDPGFKIILEAPEFESGIGALSEQVMNAGWGRLGGRVENDGTVNLELDALLIGKLKYELPEKFPEIPGVTFDIAFIFNNKEYLRDTKTLTKSLVEEIFSNYSGIRVYLEGFRVYPYGDPRDDWLEIDRDISRRIKPVSEVFLDVAQSLLGVDPKVALLKHPSNRNLLGRVNIRNKPKILEVTLNREGFIENRAFEKLRIMTRRALEWTTLNYGHFVYVYDSEKLKSTVEDFEKTRIEEEVKAGEPEQNVVERAINVVSSITEDSLQFLPRERQQDVKRYSNSALKVIENSVSQMEREMNFLRLIASSGALMWTLIHESRILVSRLDTHANSLAILSEKLESKEKERIAEIISALRETRDRFDNQFLVFLKTGTSAGTQERKSVLLTRIIDDVLFCYSTLVKDYNIDIEKSLIANLRVGPIFESEIYSIVINLLSNAIKVVIAGEGGRIKIEALKQEAGAVMRVYNDGCIDLPEEIKTRGPSPFSSDPEGRLYKRLREKMAYHDMSVVGEGSGMGLSIVKNIVESYGHSLKFPDTSEPWRTCVEVGLP